MITKTKEFELKTIIMMRKKILLFLFISLVLYKIGFTKTLVFVAAKKPANIGALQLVPPIICNLFPIK